MITKEANERMRILIFWKTHGLQATKDAFRVSRSTLFDWQKTYRNGDSKIEALNPGTQARHTQKKREAHPKIVAEIRRLRLEVCPNMGKDKVRVLLDPFCKKHGLKTLSVSTIGRVIKDKKIKHHRIKVSHFGKIKEIVKKKKQRIPHGYTPSCDGDLVQIDTIVRFVDKMKRYVITAVDVRSKYTFAWGYRRLDSANARDFFKRFRLVAPFSVRHVQTDNGSEFCKYFTRYLEKKQLIHYWNFKGKPTMNCYVEKYNRTIQEEFIDQHEYLLDDPKLFNEKLVDYLLWYNTKRPHWSLGLASPVDYMLTTNSLSRMRWTDTCP
jgi:transposase InsO family protein